MKGVIWFDMDGTLFDLYNVDNWLYYLRNFNAHPYKVAPVMHNMSLLARYLHRAQRAGCKLGIVSWLSKNSIASYDQAVTDAKLASLQAHLPSVKWDIIHIVSYGTPKENFKLTSQDILFDDEEKNRINWGAHAYTPDQIFTILKNIKAN